MFSKRLILTGAVVVAGTGATAAVHASASASQASPSADTVHLVSSLLGRNEVPSARGAVNDPDGRALEVVEIDGSKVSYSVRWQGISAPTEAHIYAGGPGVDGDLKIELFSSTRSGDTASGSVRVNDTALLTALVADPGSFYANLDTRQFPGGAVRGQLHRLSQPVRQGGPSIDVAPVVQGSQIYACTQQADGTFAFTQRDVAARLRGGIRHSFVQPVDGPPQWVAPDGTSVTGKIILKTPNGPDNIPELDLQATQTGAAHGRLAHVAEVLRLNTVRGTAPTGTCDPQRTPTAAVPYQADYLFVG
ncbi:hypothetical protein GCM10027176_56470 [Actinoallomurus bryophytorum]|uniref:Uncharacterized protein DUF3455 n=1 Tax=Actinoallomurus bryophytorum TaxID=1490222 RepID=A0A543C0F1_9ACTN|nr:CHRD domain-containing protein [Actinoallomurus bryophytorum]TQL90553.1 uncharacterized protein DUF3455 [Actinoallomurus bryophytorum]